MSATLRSRPGKAFGLLFQDHDLLEIIGLQVVLGKANLAHTESQIAGRALFGKGVVRFSLEREPWIFREPRDEHWKPPLLK